MCQTIDSVVKALKVVVGSSSEGPYDKEDTLMGAFRLYRPRSQRRTAKKMKFLLNQPMSIVKPSISQVSVTSHLKLEKLAASFASVTLAFQRFEGIHLRCEYSNLFVYVVFDPASPERENKRSAMRP